MGTAPADQRRPRFVVLRHDVGPQLNRTTASHYDWMFEVGGVLRTWATQPIMRFDEPLEFDCELLSDHRLEYLDYEGDVAGDRGSVSRLIRGAYRLIEIADDRFTAELSWRKEQGGGEGMVRFYRSFLADGLRRDDNCDFWRCRFSPGRYETNR